MIYRIGRWLQKFALAGLAITIATGAQAQETITKTEARTAPPEQTHERLRDVVWEVFELGDHRREAVPTRSLEDVSLRTSPHITYVQNLCRRDVLWVDFAPVDPSDFGPDAEVRAVGVNTTSQWSFLSPPEFDEDWYAPEAQPDELCADLPETQHFYRAQNDMEATRGYLAWIGLRRDIAAGRPVELECSLQRGDEVPCAQIIANLPFESLRSVERCNALRGFTAGGCYVLSVGSRRISVEFDAFLSGADPHVVRATLVSLIIVGDQRID